MYRASRIMTLMGRRLMPGDPIPDAEKIKNLQALMDGLWIKYVPDSDSKVDETKAESELADATLKDLKEKAKVLGLTGVARMSKADLQALIEKTEQAKG